MERLQHWLRKNQKKDPTDLERAQQAYRRNQLEQTKESFRKPRFSLRAYHGLYLFFTIGILATGYLLSPYGRVKEVLVESEAYVPEQTILEASQVSTKQTVIGTLLQASTIERSIKNALPQIKRVQVNVQDTNSIVLVTTNYETIAYISNKDTYQSVLETGEVVKEALSVPLGNKPVLTKFEPGPFLDQFIDSYQKLDEEVRNSISEVAYTGNKQNPYTITFYMNDGNQVRATIKDFATKMNYYPSMLVELKEQRGIIDMEVGVYFTPFENKQSNE